MSSVRPYIENLREDLRTHVLLGPVYVSDVASRALSSPAVVQRVFADADTTFSDELRSARAQIAFEAFAVDGIRTATRAASAVNVTPGHLTRLLKAEFGLTTRDLLRVCHLNRRITAWKDELPPRSGTQLYRQRRERWDAAYDELLTLLEPIHAKHPLRPWADGLARGLTRPDYRRRRHRAELHRRRVATTKARNRQFKRWVARVRAEREKKDA